MRLVFLICLTMAAFAANSLLTRLAVNAGHIDPAGFALVRVLSGAVVLFTLVAVRNRQALTLSKQNLPGAISLLIYMIGFSLAYLTLDAGLGALILFGVVQIVMFAHAAVTQARANAQQIAGATIAFCGLLIVLWPGSGAATDLKGALLMMGAGLGWAAYSIIGRGAQDPLAATMRSFVLCFPMLLVCFVGVSFSLSFTGGFLAILCGAVTSGLGYALWYTVLPRISGPTAAVVQLSVPIIALIAGALLLGEVLSVTILLAATLVVGGIGLAIRAR